MRLSYLALIAASIAGSAHAQTGPQPTFVEISRGPFLPPSRIPRFGEFQGVESSAPFTEPCRTGIDVVPPFRSGGFGVESSVQCGLLALAGGENATAIGANSFAVEGGTALGNFAFANGVNSTALGLGASAAFANSTAVGAGATATAANEVALGGTGSSVRVGDIDASTAAQDPATVGVATVDAGGTLGRDTTIIPAIRALQGSSGVQAAQISALQADAAAQAARIMAMEAAQSALSSRVDSLFDLRELDQRDMRQGIAAATAMGQAHFPSAPGRTSYILNVATFRGEQAIGGSIMHRLNIGAPLAISAGYSYSGNKNNAARVGVAGEF